MEIEPSGAAPGEAESVRDRLRRALPGAMKARDGAAVAALRAALSAIDNAEAADPGHAPAPGPGHPTFAGTVAGLGSGEVPRRTLTEAQIEQIVGAEISDRRRAALDFERAGRHDDAERLRRGAEALRPHLDAAHPDVTA